MNLKKVVKTFVFLVLIVFSLPILAQNLANVRVDDLTDAQVRQLMQKAAAVGYTDDAQLAQLAVAQGMNPNEIQKLTVRVQKLREQDKTNGSKTGINTQGGLSLGGRTYNFPASDLDTDTTDTSLFASNYNSQYAYRRQQMRDAYGNLVPKVFGEDLFKNSKISFEPNLRLATPKGYVIGPDDDLIIDLTGDNEASYTLRVSPEGTIRLQYVGLISVGGLTIEQATSKIKASMIRTYPGLRSGRTSVAINLGNIRSIKVTIIGEAVRPGTYTLSSLGTVFNALYASGGPSKNGSFRNIQVIRNNHVINTIDVYEFLLKGIVKNIRLQDQDIINIPVYQTRIEMSGEVKRPALYEMLSTETLQDAINFAGGFSSQAYTANIKVLQNTSRERKLVDVDASHFASYKPINGDKYVVETILNRFENRVAINGAVFRPGKYELEKGLTIKGLIAKADGLREDAFLNRGYISRLNLDNTPSLLSFDVQKILNGTEADIPLQREDNVTISSIFDLRDEYSVEIQGEVRYPGMFKYADNTSLEALIQMAGGFKEGATPNRIEISRRVRNSDASSKAAITAQIFTIDVDQNLKLVGEPFILKPFDIVSVRNSEGYQVQKIVRIQGEILYPGTYTIQRKDEKIADIIKRAGGLTAMAFPEGASLKRPGTVIKKDKKAKSVVDSIDAAEQRQRLQNLKRLQFSQGVTDTASIQDSVIRSDFVGINMVKILEDPSSRFNLLVEDGDIIEVPKELQTVRVTGEVLKPINIVYKQGKGMAKYISESGGFTYNANRKGSYVVYANGTIRSTKHFLFFRNHPSIKPGAEIFVPKRAPKQPVRIQDFIGISTALASLAAIMVALLNK
ncbi:capsule biosynthesis protein [Mucilaginibacter robiniae]|uniref:Capsule biosynthesis protein n=1 Tax=Mucilaginibacter robiniae TaxID=2728022 RepID=A0A7L5E6X2_9SPHI|nr:SLBB domain-containing protein [Mucilaginibacter robiniae]QJD97534.1 capsule biosynthesis protein [Mucilaginibacter robiniae]